MTLTELSAALLTKGMGAEMVRQLLEFEDSLRNYAVMQGQNRTEPCAGV